MRWRLFSRTASKRISGPILLCVLLAAVNPSLRAQEAVVSARVGPRSVSVAIELEHNGERVLQALDAGMRSEITYVIRLYRPSGGLARLLGDRLVAEYHPSFIAYHDPFSREYVIESAVGTLRRFESAAEFLEDFYTLAAFPIPVNTIADIGRHYLLAHVELRPVRLVPVLDFLGAVRAGEAVITPWKRLELRAPEDRA